jgi:hypothetical protein
MDLKNIFEPGKLHLKKLVMINQLLVVFIQHDRGAVGLFNQPKEQTKKVRSGNSTFEAPPNLPLPSVGLRPPYDSSKEHKAPGMAGSSKGDHLNGPLVGGVLRQKLGRLGNY